MGIDSAYSLGPYRVGDEISRGALGQLVQAVDTRSGVEVALRILKAVLAGDAVYVSRLEEQLARATQVEHPCLVRPLEWAPIDDVFVVASRFVPGASLSSLLRKGALGIAVATDVLRDVAGALGALHAGGLVHQGVSPDKVIVGGDGRAALTGAGLVTFGAYSRLTTRFDQVLGNVGYLAPEMIRGEPPTAASDIYALGCLAFACFTGHPPFDDVFIYEIPLAHLDKEAPNLAEAAPDVSDRVDELVALALAKSPHRRPSAEEFEAGLMASR